MPESYEALIEIYKNKQKQNVIDLNTDDLQQQKYS